MTRWFGSRALIVLVVLATMLSGCAGAGPTAPHARRSERPPSSTKPTASTSTTATAAAARTTPCGWARAAPARDEHVVWIWMENHSWSEVIGNPAAPYVTALAHQCATDDHDAAVGSPSLPNYLGAASGSTQGLADDADPAAHSFAVDNLFGQVRSAGGTERSYVESMPAPCTLTSSGSYAAKHNPAVYFDGPGDRSACATDDLPFSDFSAVLSSGDLPTFTSITPNLCDDMHDCSVTTGDQWLSTWLPRILATSSYRSGTTAVFVIWDEPSPVANVVVAPSVRPGTVAALPIDHYSVLRTTEELLGLPLLGQAATATSLRAGLNL
jgi:hypothetical protein